MRASPIVPFASPRLPPDGGPDRRRVYPGRGRYTRPMVFRSRLAALLALAALACVFAPAARAQSFIQGLRTDLTVGSSPYSVALADIDGTGLLDIVCANYNSSTISIYTDHGFSLFDDRQDLAAANGPRAIAVGDVNGDGIPDLLTVSSAGATLSVILGRRGGTFETRRDFVTSNGPRALALGDVNGDG